MNRSLSLLVAVACCLLLAAVGGCGDSSITGGGGSGGDDSDAGPDQPPPPLPECACDNCGRQTVGIGGQPFDLVADPSEFVGTDGAGALVVDKSNSRYNKYLWVADTNLSGVVKIDLDTFTIVGRYRTGGGSTSRTTVNARGEAFVGARSNGNGPTGVTKILPYGADCPDTNGDGVITTSTGINDVLPYGQDDCVAWHVATEGDIRGLAAQDIAGVKAGDACTEEDDTSVDVPEQHYVWAGGLHGKIYKIDADTGDIVMNLTAPSGVYGMALAGDGKLWTGSQLAFLDTTQCTDQAACNAAPVCDISCSGSSCPDTCDGAVKGRVQGVGGYGITVDCQDRVWMSGGSTVRYDPNAPVDARYAQGAASGSGGIAADADGWVWACTNGNSIVRLDADTLEATSIAAPAKGVAVDSTGRILTVYGSGVHMIDPGLTLEAYDLFNDVTALAGFAYAYSDMSGVQTRLASDDPGWYRHTFEGCAENTNTFWRTLEWDLEAPADTYVAFYARSADTMDELATAEWQLVANCLESAGCSDAAGITEQNGRYLEIEARLTNTSEEPVDGPKGCGYVEGDSARVRSFTVTNDCTGPLG